MVFFSEMFLSLVKVVVPFHVLMVFGPLFFFFEFFWFCFRFFFLYTIFVVCNSWGLWILYLVYSIYHVSFVSHRFVVVFAFYLRVLTVDAFLLFVGFGVAVLRLTCYFCLRYVLCMLCFGL